MKPIAWVALLWLGLTVSEAPLARAATRGEPADRVPGKIRGKDYGTLPGRRVLDDEALFGKTTPSWQDVRQGAADDCYYLAPLSALAHLDSEAITRQFARNADGSLQLSDQGEAYAIFYRRDAQTKAFTRDLVPVDAQLVLSQNGEGSTVFARAVDGKLWAPLLEKAYAKWRRSQEHGAFRAEGGDAALSMEALTGRAATSYVLEPTPKDAAQTYERMKRAVGQGRLLVAATSYGGNALRHRQAEAIKSGLVDEGARSWHFDADGLVDTHAYAVFDVFERDGQRLVQLRNPFGSHVKYGSGPNDGLLEVPFDRFMFFFDSLYVGGKVGAPLGEK